MGIVLLVIILLLGLFVMTIYNRGVVLRNYVREAFSTMDVYHKKRWDLIPNLVETVKGYIVHEKGLLNQLTELRAKNYSEMSDSEKLDTNKQIGAAMNKIFAIAENYPDIKSNQNFMKLMDDLNLLEDDIANARKYYNGTVRELNTFLEVFPSNIIGSFFNFKKETLFEIDESERENIKVKF